jgi:hypothetical protein
MGDALRTRLLALLFLLPAIGCDIPTANVANDAAARQGRDRAGLNLSDPGEPSATAGSAAASADCPTKVEMEPYPCSGPCLAAPGAPQGMGCMRPQRTCYRPRRLPRHCVDRRD